MQPSEETKRRLAIRPDNPEEMSIMVRTIIRSLLPIVLIYGFYIISYGHLTPGGGFQGGMILVGAVMTFYLAYGYNILRRYTAEQLELAEAGAIIAYLLVGLTGLLRGGFFDNLFRGGIPGSLLSGGTLPVLNAVVGLKVATGTLVVILVLLEALRKGDD